MSKAITENRYTIRKYLRTLSVSKNVIAYARADTDPAIKFFIILHNMLILEDEFYDQCLMGNKEINRHLRLSRTWRVDDILAEFYKLYDRDSKVRKNIETITKVEDIRYVLKQNPNLYKKLKI